MGRDYSSARLNTLTLTQFAYGRTEIGAKPPNAQGIWPAIRMLPTLDSSPIK